MDERASLLSNALKRALDVTVASVGLAAFALPLAAAAGAIKLDSPGPVFYRGERVGRGGSTFRIFKFRTMHTGPRKGPDSTTDDDPRITRIGKLLRRYKVDELPQLVNVLLGQMSLVGPRPQVRWAVDRYTPEERAILAVRPGITDWASLKFHNEGEILAQSGYTDPDEAYWKLIHPEKTRLQLEYVREHSLLVDVGIVLDTLKTLVRTRTGNGAHP